MDRQETIAKWFEFYARIQQVPRPRRSELGGDPSEFEFEVAYLKRCPPGLATWTRDFSELAVASYCEWLREEFSSTTEQLAAIANDGGVDPKPLFVLSGSVFIGVDGYGPADARMWDDAHACAKSIQVRPGTTSVAGTDVQGELTHSPDFRSVNWQGETYCFTPNQAAAVKILWECWEQNTPDVGDNTLLEAIESQQPRLRDAFTKHPAWGILIVEGGTKGTHRLAI